MTTSSSVPTEEIVKVVEAYRLDRYDNSPDSLANGVFGL